MQGDGEKKRANIKIKKTLPFLISEAGKKDPRPGCSCLGAEMFSFLFFFFLTQPIPTSPTSTSPTPGGTLGMSKMDGPSMQDVYILSPVSGLYGTR